MPQNDNFERFVNDLLDGFGVTLEPVKEKVDSPSLREDLRQLADEMIEKRTDGVSVLLGRLSHMALEERAEREAEDKAEVLSIHELRPTELWVIHAALDIVGAYITQTMRPSYGAMLDPTLGEIAQLLDKVEHLALHNKPVVQSPF